ncbi:MULTISPECIES: VOC family protein [Sphingobium]|uniref:VOC family protein n=1 Tax=Sphingobium TaxID=165695 RepID=UPI0015EC7B8C|nr:MULTISPECIES: VOC family protein [Sphingobium]MCW2351300.1 catechol 2,3-dioxygenase-like lactoylglutathione lyase family enzyme [Sphingobium sp. B12D2B]MCW2364444.1 catechol 2,3-dioxygenase-like lactoylglutathione lyase family enzyme [Sphingobium sp. B10D3B]MCW2370521.1 catechol 2,3-dioxygenase-like lactoylglutathione lyase family enzyme [Sphingobium sp. B11D3D]MCW2380894.1 catechol 2,3-dioxygenase-like lactoylglutathione lyase family enzyme [Sphingobium sp. B2D3B]MCW2398999.1 catechol 2,3-
MLFHTMVGSNDIERAKRFYDTVLGTLGVGEATVNVADSGHKRLIYNNGNGTNFIVTQPINDEPATVANGGTVAFSCSSPEQVKQFHDVAVANGATSIEAPPGPRNTASLGTIELAYFRDPDGNKLCGIHFPQ